MMSRVRARGAAAALVALLACGGGSQGFPAEAANEFLDVCAAQDTDEMTCQCVLDYVEGRFSLGELNRLTADMEIGEGLPEDLVDDAIAECLGI